MNDITLKNNNLLVISLLYLKDYLKENDLYVILSLNKSYYNSFKNIYNNNNYYNNGDSFYKSLYNNYLNLYLKIFKSLSIKTINNNNWWEIVVSSNNNSSNKQIQSIKENFEQFTLLKSNFNTITEKYNFLLQCKFNLHRYLDNNESYISIVRNEKISTLERVICFSIIFQQDQFLYFLIKIIVTIYNINVNSNNNNNSNNFNNNNNINTNNLNSSTSNRISINQNNLLLLQFNQSLPTLNEFLVLNKCIEFKSLNWLNNLKIYPIYFTIAKGNVNLLKFLLNILNGIYSNINTLKLPNTNRSPLFYATTREMTLLLLQLGCKINDVDYKGMLPIHFHSLNGHIDVVKCLIDDSTINAQDSTQNTPLHLSALCGHLSLIKTLLSNGARINIENSQGRLPIHNACMNAGGNSELIKFFIDLYSKMTVRTGLKTSGGSLNQVTILIPDKEKNTPMDLLVLNNHFSNAIELLKYEGYILNKNEFNLKNARKIGSGAFGDVYLLEWRNKNVAIKRVKIEKILESGKTFNWVRDKFILEVVLMVKLSSFSNFVKLYGTCIEDDELLLILEYCDNSSLFNILNTIGNENVVQSLPAINTLSLNIANGMNYLHSLKPQIIHRDLTSQNILIDKNGVAKIADLGISRFKNELGDKTMTSIGNPRWRAPEVTKGQKYSEKVDVFGFGMILYEMFTRRVPFHEHEQVQASFKIASGERPTLPSSVDSRWINLIQLCWDQNPNNRPSFAQILDIIQNLPIAFIPKVLNSIAQPTLVNQNNAVSAKLSLSTSGTLFGGDSDYTVGTYSIGSYDVGYDNDGDNYSESSNINNSNSNSNSNSNNLNNSSNYDEMEE
ncbi:hypothetical protein DICPUDRAFT_99201 [Dictyostelium purpureum]|uniref:non-specific serine/threonine protein kinase n=1 Tax=Dictyostelium purpureum TaxID=5786 RepID=F0ZX48_DICPU|nr:uncharacterized protein DICPUDRAFT_99201 [Dictyostelium purpureum]EGC31480.1 hypothetical protein DICPUDRAFT_99201 [Dictyostelium purpureum]|eukprot:XP_003291985.1 hypothetical protein DICPUDRAFT_99201 [Dictyostelium purpureum]